MSKVYLAAPYGERVGQALIAQKFRDAGHEVTARWIDGSEFDKPGPEAAAMDVDDVKRADWLILRTFPRGTYVTGGGRHFEFGLAYALGKRCIIVGECEHVFCWLEDVDAVESYDDALEIVNEGI